MTPAPILVLIVNYRTPTLTMQAVAAIANEVRARGDAHILVVDNGSRDGSAAQIEAAIIREGIDDCCSLLTLAENLGFAAGNNAGLEHYRSTASEPHWPDLVWLLNPDTIAQPHALNSLLDFMGLHPGAGIAGGQSLRLDGTIRPSAFRFHSPLSELLTALDLGPLRRLFAGHDLLLPVENRPIRAEWLSGSHIMIRGTLFDRIGLLDPRYFLYFEETDFCARAAAVGAEIWHVPDSRVIHLGGESTGVTEVGEAARRPPYWFASRARFFLRRYGVTRTHLANLLWLIATPSGTLIAWLRRRPRHDPPRLWRDFLRQYYGPGGLMYRTRALAA